MFDNRSARLPPTGCNIINVKLAVKLKEIVKNSPPANYLNNSPLNIKQHLKPGVCTLLRNITLSDWD